MSLASDGGAEHESGLIGELAGRDLRDRVAAQDSVRRGSRPTNDQHDVKYAFIAERKLSDTKMEMGRRAPPSFTVEVELMRELNFPPKMLLTNWRAMASEEFCGGASCAPKITLCPDPGRSMR